MKLQVGVKVLIRNTEQKYLLLKRASAMDDEAEAHWDIPGGRIEPEEPLLEALTREIREETGLCLAGKPSLIGAQDIFVPAKNLHVVRLTYIADGEGEPTVSHEHQDATWVTLDEAHELNLDPYLREIVDQQKNT